MHEMTVAELARRVGTSPDTIRYYERIGLLPSARSPVGYRLFDDQNVERVHFVKRAQRFGLQLDEIRELLDIRERGLCPCGHAKQLLSDKLAEINSHLEQLSQLRDDVQDLLHKNLSADAEGCWPCGTQLIQIDPGPRRTP